MADSIFTKIIKGEIPAYQIYEDDKTIAILDIHPLTYGHTLVIPKVQIASLWDLSLKDYQAVMSTTRLMAKRLRREVKTKYLSMRVVGIDVPHAHVHLIPFNKNEELQRVQNFDVEPDDQQLSELVSHLEE